MTRSNVAAKVAKHKRLHPELYCPHPKCLWRTNGGRCPRHPAPKPLANALLDEDPDFWKGIGLRREKV